MLIKLLVHFTREAKKREAEAEVSWVEEGTPDAGFLFSMTFGDLYVASKILIAEVQALDFNTLVVCHFAPMLKSFDDQVPDISNSRFKQEPESASEFKPDDTRKLQLEAVVGSVCVGSTGRLGVCTHVDFVYGGWVAAGFGLDGKGVWTAASPVEIDTAKNFYDKLNKRFDGKLSYHDMSSVNIDDVAQKVADKLHREIL